MRAAEWLHLLLMTAVAAYLRLPGLGELSLYGDEEYTAVAVQAVLADGLPRMPSGVPYWRGAPYTYLAAVSAHYFGLSEFSFRLPSAVIGVLTIPVFYALARRLIGVLPAIPAGWLLVFSAWHIDVSREARMYATFLAFSLLTLLCFLRAIEGRRASFGLLAILVPVSVALHQISLLLVPVLGAILGLRFHAFSRYQKLLSVTSLVGLSAVWLAYPRVAALISSPLLGTAAAAPTWLGSLKLLQPQYLPHFWSLSHAWEHQPLLLVLAAFLSAVLLWWNWALHKTEVSRSLLIGFALLTALGVLNLFGLVFLGAASLLLVGGSRYVHLAGQGHCRWMSAQLATTAILWISYGLLVWRGEGVQVQSGLDLVRKVLKDSFGYPALHILPYLEAFPFMTLTVVAGTLLWIVRYAKGYGKGHAPTAIFLCFWLPLLAIGFKAEWVYLRYTILLYPFYLLIFAWTLSEGFQVALRASPLSTPPQDPSFPPRRALVAIPGLTLVLLALPLLNEQHGVRDALLAARLSYNQSVDPLWHGFPYHPDHKSPGEYVKGHLEPGDTVIAMDVFQQYYYAGRADYWLTGDVTKRAFAFRQGDSWYDIYTRTVVITRRDELEPLINSRIRRSGRVWLITSGELAYQMPSMFSPDVIEFLSALEPHIVFVGRDGQTRVYRFEGPE